jgi:hypothetical protein
VLHWAARAVQLWLQVLLLQPLLLAAAAPLLYCLGAPA